MGAILDPRVQNSLHRHDHGIQIFCHFPTEEVIRSHPCSSWDVSEIKGHFIAAEVRSSDAFKSVRNQFALTSAAQRPASPVEVHDASPQPLPARHRLEDASGHAP